LRDHRFGRKAFKDLLPKGSSALLLFQDAPEHTRLRNLLSKVFTASVGADLPSKIERIADCLLAARTELPAMDIISDFATPLPVYVMSDILGVPAEEREPLVLRSREIALGMDGEADPPARARAVAAQNCVADYFRSLIAERSKRPRADLVTRLINAADEEGHRLTESETLDGCELLFFTGHQTTINLIGNGILALLRHPGELQVLREDPTLLSSAVEELLRYESPVQRTGRMTNSAVEMGGKTIPKGSVVLAILGAANRDPSKFVQPDRLDIGRLENRHLAFGFGPRFCLGAMLARLEGAVAIRTLLRLLPSLTLATEPPIWRNSTEIRGLLKLPVSLSPRT